MLRKLFIVPVILLPVCLFAQYDRLIDSVLDNKIIQLPFYKQSTTGNKSLLFKMNFGKPEILDTTGVSALCNAEILSVDLVFTDYPSSQTLKPLNKKRFINLVMLCPSVVKQSQVQWQIIRQMDGKDKASAERLLHGIVVNYREQPTEATHRNEINLVSSFSKRFDVPAPAPKPAAVIPVAAKKVNYWSIIHGGQITKPRYYKDRVIKDITDKPVPVTAEDELMIVPSKQITGLLNGNEQQRFFGKDSLYLLVNKPQKNTTPEKVNEGTAPPLPVFKDSTLLKPLLRNKWNNPVVVADVTLSMAPYTMQLIGWLSQPQQKNAVQYFTCFNDGNDIQQSMKIIGETGGVYGTSFTGIKAVSSLVETAMENGSGGDTPENVCEAIIKSIAMCNTCKEVVLMADNWAPVRDIELVKKIDRPVHIIVCGGTTGTHVDYIQIALQTNGSISFEDEEVTNLQDLKIGKEVTIRGINYKLNSEGKIIVMRK